MIETWVYNQLMPEIDLHPLWTIEHLRTSNHEVDFVITDASGNVLGIEVKASQSVQKEDFSHLKWFGERLAPAGISYKGVVLYAVGQLRSFGRGCYAVPFACMWVP